MTSQGEKFGSALAKAIRGTTAAMKERKAPPEMYSTNLKDVPKVEGLKRDDGWVDMQVQFLIDKKPRARTMSSAGRCSSPARGTRTTGT